MKNELLNWVAFFLEASIQTAKAAKTKFREAVQLVQTYNEKLAIQKTTESALTVIKAMYSKPVATINELTAITGLTPPTVSQAIKALQDEGILHEMTGNRRNRIFAMSEYINVFR